MYLELYSIQYINWSTLKEFVQNTSDVEPFSDTQPPASGVAPIQSLKKKKKKRALPKEDGEDEDEPPKRRKSSPIEVDVRSWYLSEKRISLTRDII